MFDTLKSLLNDLSGRKEEPPVVDERLATAALLVHTIAIDGDVTPRERTELHAALTRAFGLSRAETEDLIEQAREWDNEAVDLYGFTSVLKRSLPPEGRERVIEMMWEIIYADGGVHEFEDNMVWRVAELLGVSARDRIRLRKRIESRTAAD
ncbi:MAG TPA: TerB family tellurite resistance protein [Methylomirabilota bacterium]|nr:TerB family tellurite resistance protein [Methylomirabilota bacterium]